ncbi:ACP S-malonyltransferase [Streptomyces sp. NPDC058683]|uniref:ACP S-malonyltransferase n=1 Tax=Streptomyces sp. NPDC058683 TaxID=3346597 RepID=UPI0036480435
MSAPTSPTSPSKPPEPGAAHPDSPLALTPPGTRIGLLFPGQGAQRPGMDEPWRDTEHWQVVERLSEACARDLGELLLHTDADRLTRTDNAQLATFTLDMVVLDALRTALGTLRPAVCAGHSLGEYAALTAAGVLDPEDAVRLVAERGAAMAEAAARVPGTMTVLVGPDVARTAELLAGRLRTAARAEVWVANVNGPDQVVVSGSPAGVTDLTERATATGARAIRIPVGGAFHSPLMAAARSRLATAVARTPVRPGRCPVIANVDGLAHQGDAPAVWRARMLGQLVLPVRWSDSMATLATLPGGPLRLVELGPGRTLTGIGRRLLPAQVPVHPVATPAQLAALVADGRPNRSAVRDRGVAGTPAG